MAEDVAGLRAEAAAALEAGDSAAANAAYARELAELSGAGAAGPDDDADAGDEHEAAEPEHDADADTDLPDEDAPAGPWPVEHTSAVYEAMRSEFGDQEADHLQRAWGDHAPEHHALAGALAADARLAPVLERHLTDSGAVTARGALAAIDALQAAGVPAEVLNDPHLEALVRERMSEDGSLSPAGARIALAHIAKRWGYKLSRRASPRTSTAKEHTMPTITSELKQGDELRTVREQIEQAQARGDSRRANLLYKTEQALIARQRGNRPIVGGGRNA